MIPCGAAEWAIWHEPTIPVTRFPRLAWPAAYHWASTSFVTFGSSAEAFDPFRWESNDLSIAMIGIHVPASAACMPSIFSLQIHSDRSGSLPDRR